MRRTFVLLIIVASFGVTLGRAPRTFASDADQGFAFTDKVVLAYYYIWFQEESWLRSLEKGAPISPMFDVHPLAGTHTSYEPAIIEKHMQQMNRALIDALARVL